MEKAAYISPSVGELNITITHDARPTVVITLDVGIPNFTVFSIKFPFIPGEVQGMTQLAGEALEVLLDEVTAFMLSMKYDEEVATQLYAACLACFASLTLEADSESSFTDIAKDNHVQQYLGTFKLPQPFIDETFKKVVTAATTVKRPPQYRKVVLQKEPPAKPTLNDAARVIKMYRNRTLRTQPKPLYVIVYDQNGKPAGSIDWRGAVKHKLNAAAVAKLPLYKALAALRPQMAEAAQKVYDEWEQDEEGIDIEYGAGGICDRISQAIQEVINTHLDQIESSTIHTLDAGQDGDDHQWCMCYNEAKTEVYGIDIPYSLYEHGGGYNWKKKEGVTFTANDVEIFELPKEAADDDYWNG